MPAFDVPDGARRGDRGGAQLGPPLGRDDGRRALLDDLLVAALDRALALEEMDHGAVGVPEDLHLDVAGPRHVRLHEDGAVTEGGGRFSLGRGNASASPSGPSTTRMPRPPPPAEAFTSTGHPRAATASGDRAVECVRPPVGDLDGGEHGHARGGHGGLGRELRAHGLDHLGRRSDEDEPGRHTGPGEPGVLGQEPVAGMDGVGAAAPRRRRPTASTSR